MAVNLHEEIDSLLAEVQADLPFWVHTAVSYYLHPPLPVVGASLTQIIMSQTRNFGPSPRTGGVIHALTLDQAKAVADIIEKYCAKYNMPRALILSGIVGESCCDPRAINPNNQRAKHDNETPEEQFAHTDIGIAQFDGSTLTPDNRIFADLKGLLLDEIKSKAFDADWAISKYLPYVTGIFTSAETEVRANPKILDGVPDRDVRVLALTSYNAGVHGAQLKALQEGTAGNWSYGQNWLKRWQSYANILGERVQYNAT